MAAHSVFFSLFVISFFHSTINAICSSSDSQQECQSLIDFGNSLNYKQWTTNTDWMSDKSICDWYGIECKSGHVTEIRLKANHLIGSLPVSIANLTNLLNLDLEGTSTQSGNYSGCIDNNLKQTHLPETIYSLIDITEINLEFSCLGGTISNAIGNLVNLELFEIHGNYISGTIPSSLDKCINLQQLKLGRNPLTGTVPTFNNLHKLQKFNCNFCAITGQFPDNLDKFPSLIQLYWDGNALNGTLPKTISTLKNLEQMSFNINDLSGTIDDSLCDNPPNDCRIGSDTNYSAYTANYPWLIKAKGNLYKCPLPKCAATIGAACDSKNSIVNCTNVP